MVWIIIEATVAMMMMLKPRHQLLPRGDKGRRSLLGASADLLKHHSSSMALPRNLKNNENFSDPQCNIGVETSIAPFALLTVFENHRKSLIQHCGRSELRLHFEWTKVD